MKHILISLVLILCIGCQSSAPKAKREPTQAAKDLTAKLKGMSPQERTEYLKSHPEELRAVTGVK
jgi:hypothetical protein